MSKVNDPKQELSLLIKNISDVLKVPDTCESSVNTPVTIIFVITSFITSQPPAINSNVPSDSTVITSEPSTSEFSFSNGMSLPQAPFKLIVNVKSSMFLLLSTTNERPNLPDPYLPVQFPALPESCSTEKLVIQR